MSGKKGRSGRKPLLEESKVEEILRVSSDILLRWLQNNLVPDYKKVQVVSQLVGKRIPMKVEGQGFGGDTKIIIIRSEKKDNVGIESNTQTVPGRLPIQQ